MKVTDVVWRLAEPVAKKAGCDLWDVEYIREGGEWYLRVYLDKPDEPVGIDDCEAVSRALDPILDEADPIDTSYTFEVCSAGAERVLKRAGDYLRFLGSNVLVKLFRARDGSKEFTGILKSYNEETGELVLTAGQGTAARDLTFQAAERAQTRLCISFS